MEENKEIDWLYDLQRDVPGFLNKLKGEKRKGFYRYSLTGDYFSERIRWGLGNSVFFLKIIYTLGLENKFKTEVKESVCYIKSFQKKNGYFYDDFLDRISFAKRIIRAIKNISFSNILGQQTRRAETRQAISALALFNEKPNFNFTDYPKNINEVDKYLNELDWESPWGAGSHFSHLMFFLNFSDLGNKNELIIYAINFVNKLQNNDDGFWYRGNPSLQQKINGAMKILTGLKVANKMDFSLADKITDNALIAKNDTHACDNFNITYVLRYCNEMLKSEYRFNEIEDFMYNRLEEYRKFYYPSLGGFSFYKNKANQLYYESNITKGKNEPDIHGTVMFLWGISLVLQTLNLNKEIKFKEHIA